MHAIYDASRFKDSGEDSSLLKIFDKGGEFNIEDYDADGIRILGNDYLKTQNIGLIPTQEVRPSQAAELFTNLNSFYKAVLERIIGDYKIKTRQK